MTTTETITNVKLTAAEKDAKRIEDMKIKLKQARARVQKRNSKLRHSEQAAARKIDTRKRVLVGAYVLDKMPELARSGDFQKWLVRDDERALFGFQPLPAKEAA
jgi:hypothetical protein